MRELLYTYLNLQNDSEMVSLSQLETMLKVLEKDKDKLGEIERISELLKVSLDLYGYIFS